MPLSLEENLVNNADNSKPNANVDIKAQPCIRRHVKLSADLDSMVKSSPGEGKNKLFQLMKDPFCSDQVVDRTRRQAVTLYKQIKLVQFLQDSLRIRGVIADHNKRSQVVHCKSNKCTNTTPCNFLPFRKKAEDDHSQYKWNMAKTAECFNFLPLFSLNPIRKIRRFNPVANAK